MQVKTQDGRFVDYEAVENLMDDELREELHREIAPCSPQRFFDKYAEMHAERFGEEFPPSEW